MESQIYELLETGAFMRTIEIAKAVNGPEARCKSVNPTLYAMQNSGMITKTAEENGANPRWRLTNQPRTDSPSASPE